MIKVTVPATTANLGPGFDTLGLALDIEATFTFAPAAQFEITGCPQRYCNENNLVRKAYCRLFQKLNEKPIPVRITIDSPIPTSRGLGSSSACILGGLCGANALLGEPVSALDLLRLACELEGHPDNVTPALLGGLKAALVEQDCLLTADFSVSERLRFAALVPDFELETHRARQALPDAIPHAQAAGALGKLAFLLKGLETADSALLEAAMNEPLHEPYRIPLIPEYEEVRQLCVNQGAAAVMISGSGPTLLTLFIDTLPEAALTLKLKSLNHHWQLLPCRVQHEGTRIEMKEEPHE
ncbi:homoserine kinase [Holdemania filiformis]|uniref:homoserine kinase n=1 Tax=Holdemania filiformis TaxID=61171 RepID=UPI00266F1366|nr:homoserine kinase [Holdemania filiformis]